MGKPNIEKMERKRDIKGLVKALGHEDPSISGAARDALGRIGPPAMKHLLGSLKKKSSSMLKKYGSTPPGIKMGLGFRRAREIGELEKEASMILALLEAIGEPSEDPLTKLLKNKLPFIRVSAAEALGRMRVRRAVDPLIQTLRDPDWSVRGATLRAFAQIRDVRAIAPVIQCLKDCWTSPKHLVSQREWIKSLARKTLLELAGAEAVEPLIQALKIQDPVVRHVVIEVLERIGDARATEPVIECLKDDDFWVRRGAAKALLKFRDARAVEPLIEAMKLPDYDALLTAVEALGLFGDARAVQPLLKLLDDEHQESRVAAGKALGQLHARGFTMSLTRPEILERVNWIWEYTQHVDAPEAHKYHDCSHHTDTPGRKDRVEVTLLSESQMEW